MPRRQAGGDLKTTCRKSSAAVTAVIRYTQFHGAWMPKESIKLISHLNAVNYKNHTLALIYIFRGYSGGIPLFIFRQDLFVLHHHPDKSTLYGFDWIAFRIKFLAGYLGAPLTVTGICA